MTTLKELERAFRKNQISRRDFMAQATALGGSLALSTSLASGSALAETPKRGGTLRVGCSGSDTSAT